MVRNSWTVIELNILRINRALPASSIRVVLKRSGYTRTEAAIETQLSAMRKKEELRETLPHLELPERKDGLDNSMTMLIPSTPLQQKWMSSTHPVIVTLTRDEEHLPFDEVWETTLRPGCKFGSYALLREVLMP